MAESTRVNEEIMKLKDANCKNCYKCVRGCPVEAISILGERANIVEERCTYCGKCYIVCPQDARDLIGDLDRVKKMVADGEKVYVSVSSTLSVFFPQANLRSLAVPLKKLGFARVEDTATGSGRMLQEYEEVLYEHEMDNIISTMCPSTNFLIQKYFPDLVKWMMPVDTPLEAHAKMMRAAYGEDIRVVGIGPCIAYHKLANIAEDGELIDAYLTFEELETWFHEEGLEITEEEDSDTFFVSNYRWKYPDETGGLIRAMSDGIKYSYKLLENNGSGRVNETMEQFRPEIRNYFFTVTACSDSCLGGPIFRLHNRDTFQSKDVWLDSVWKDVSGAQRNPSEKAEVDVRKTYEPLEFEKKMPNGEELKYILSLVGRKTKKDMLDCGGCGYSSCVDKAIAVYQGMADPFMCIPNARDKAEAESNLLFDNAPSGVLVLDHDMNILEANAQAEAIIDKTEAEMKGVPVTDYLEPSFFDHAKYSEKRVLKDTLECRAIDKILAVTYFKVARHDISMVMMTDRTAEERRYREAISLRAEAIEVTQEVVEKQMRIAQEIASLLGETTADSKLAFNRLRNLLMLKNEELWDEDGQ